MSLKYSNRAVKRLPQLDTYQVPPLYLIPTFICANLLE